MLELQHISFERDNKKILDDVNIRFEDNKFVAITGPNGSGKSMLAKIIMGIVKVYPHIYILFSINMGKYILNHAEKCYVQ